MGFSCNMAWFLRERTIIIQPPSLIAGGVGECHPGVAWMMVAGSGVFSCFLNKW